MYPFDPAAKPFGTTAAGEEVFLITLKNDTLACEILTYGATLRSLFVSDRSGTRRDVVLGYDTLQEYETQDGYLGATIGRYANRIANGRFRINEQTYSVATNNGENHLHGGRVGFSHRVWTIEELCSDKVCLSLVSGHMEEGYPGKLNVRVTYSLHQNALAIHYSAVSDADTICNLTNHSYFNLAGHSSGPIYDQEIMITAQSYTPTDAHSIPTGQIAPVESTPMDLRLFHKIGSHLADDFPQLTQAGGYDHNFVVDGQPGTLRPAAKARCAAAGIAMEVDTTLPGIQFYTANFLEDGRVGKDRCSYGPQHGFCLETQFFPDSPNQLSFPSALLKAGEVFDHKTVFSFHVF